MKFIMPRHYRLAGIRVAPHTGMGIEIVVEDGYFVRKNGLLPTRGCGLKYYAASDIQILKVDVAPHTGMWIEMAFRCTMPPDGKCVAPHTGMWIEIP